MTSYSREDIQWLSRLQESFGSDIELEDEQGKSVMYQLVAEFEVQGQGYAVIQAPNASAEDYELLRVQYNGDGEPELTTIEDDEEWEDIAELYDEVTLPEEA
ncbi:DUF1292 domain-containing protein [Paenibacillus massiliensis]|uniref:DUF1292 domain-containing protein n=1 Tax=Paenibacillus massiliensis TaxID=225917 RepID=UPI0003F50F2D|nr:DUF1292 domain-containing protein [Paenibacillus massiliensis]